MAQENKDIVKKYHQKLTTIKIRLLAPNQELNIPDYIPMIRDRAKELGFINEKGIDKGEGSINAYMLHLIEKDLNIEMIKGMNDLKESK